MNKEECSQERFSSRSVGLVVLVISMLMFVIGLVILPVVGFFFAVPLLVLGVVLVFAPESAACRLIRKGLPFS